MHGGRHQRQRRAEPPRGNARPRFYTRTAHTPPWAAPTTINGALVGYLTVSANVAVRGRMAARQRGRLQRLGFALAPWERSGWAGCDLADNGGSVRPPSSSPAPFRRYGRSRAPRCWPCDASRMLLRAASVTAGRRSAIARSRPDALRRPARATIESVTVVPRKDNKPLEIKAKRVPPA